MSGKAAQFTSVLTTFREELLHMEAYPKPRTRGRGRGSRGGRGRGKGGRGGPSGAARGGGRGRSRASADLPLDSNYDRYVEHEDAGSGSSSDDGVDFEVAAASGIQSHALDSDRPVDVDDLTVLGELAADFSNLGNVLGSVPLWVRLGGGVEVREALGADKTESVVEFLIDKRQPTGVTAALLDEFRGVDIGEGGNKDIDGDEIAVGSAAALSRDDEIPSDALREPSAGKATSDEDDDGFDAWLDGA